MPSTGLSKDRIGAQTFAPFLFSYESSAGRNRGIDLAASEERTYSLLDGSERRQWRGMTRSCRYFDHAQTNDRVNLGFIYRTGAGRVNLVFSPKGYQRSAKIISVSISRILMPWASTLLSNRFLFSRFPKLPMVSYPLPLSQPSPTISGPPASTHLLPPSDYS